MDRINALLDSKCDGCYEFIRETICGFDMTRCGREDGTCIHDTTDEPDDYSKPDGNPEYTPEDDSQDEQSRLCCCGNLVGECSCAEVN